MATQNIPTNQTNINPTSTYRLAGSCDIRTYVACDDTPYHMERPVSQVMPNAHYSQSLTEKLAALRETREGRNRNALTLIRLIQANPEATVTELANLINQ